MSSFSLRLYVAKLVYRDHIDTFARLPVVLCPSPSVKAPRCHLFCLVARVPSIPAFSIHLASSRAIFDYDRSTRAFIVSFAFTVINSPSHASRAFSITISSRVYRGQVTHASILDPKPRMSNPFSVQTKVTRFQFTPKSRFFNRSPWSHHTFFQSFSMITPKSCVFSSHQSHVFQSFSMITPKSCVSVRTKVTLFQSFSMIICPPGTQPLLPYRLRSWHTSFALLARNHYTLAHTICPPRTQSLHPCHLLSWHATISPYHLPSWHATITHGGARSPFMPRCLVFRALIQ